MFSTHRSHLPQGEQTPADPQRSPARRTAVCWNSPLRCCEKYRCSTPPMFERERQFLGSHISGKDTNITSHMLYKKTQSLLDALLSKSYYSAVSLNPPNKKFTKMLYTEDKRNEVSYLFYIWVKY